jgi:hypothetical protein
MLTFDVMSECLNRWHKNGLNMHRMLTMYGWHQFDSGAFKDVYMQNGCDFVVKVNNGCYADNEGMNEPDNYKTAPAHIRPFLVPLLAWGTGWQIQPLVNGVGCGDWLERTRYNQICPVAGLPDMDCKNHVHNPDGTVAIYDYGQVRQWLPDPYFTRAQEVA